MKIEIHDVDHGGCAVITSPSGHRMMLDCGQNTRRTWFPSITYDGSVLDMLMFLNLDEDHLEDLEKLAENTTIRALGTNPTVGANELAAMKTSGMRSGVRTAWKVLNQLGGGFHGDWQNDLGGVHWHAFWNRYGVDFTETNNLSLAVFVSFGKFTILFGGDMECEGWNRLIANSTDFRAKLLSVNVYVASHHGRENGKCENLFAWMRPDLVVFSDGQIQHGTQETSASWYAVRSKGIPDYSRLPRIDGSQPLRNVMTTRSDRTITIDVNTLGGYNVIPACSTPPPMVLGGLLGIGQGLSAYAG